MRAVENKKENCDVWRLKIKKKIAMFGVAS